MPLQIVRNDIRAMRVDAIVSPSNCALNDTGGIARSIRTAAGPRLDKACARLGGCETGYAKITRGYRLPARYVIHTAGPVWRDGRHGEREQLASCYRSCLHLAKKHRLKSIAFPLISSGTNGFPKDLSVRTAVDIIGSFLSEYEMMVFLVIFDRNSYQISAKLYASIAAYIDDDYARIHEPDKSSLLMQAPPVSASKPQAKALTSAMNAAELLSESMTSAMAAAEPPAEEPTAAAPGTQTEASPRTRQNQADGRSLEDYLRELDESFSEMLLRKIDEKGLTDAQCYKKANVDRRLFSKIRSNAGYRPSKTTVLAFAVALELPLSETREMLMKAGFSLSHSSKFDMIVEYFIMNGNYNIFEINEALFAFDQSLLGA